MPTTAAPLSTRMAGAATRSRHRLERLVILAHLLCALVYGGVVPLWEAPDEPQHYGYVADLVNSGFTLPRQRLGTPSEAHQPPLHYALAAAITAQEGLQLALMTQSDPFMYQCQYLFPVIAPLSILTAPGRYEFAGRRPRLVTPLVAWLPCVALSLALGVAAPAYASVALPRWALPMVQQNGGADLGGRFVLLGHVLRQRTAPDRLEVTLYWQAREPPDFDYSAFVHLVDGHGTLVAQYDHGPGGDRDYQPTSWLAGDVVNILPPGLEQGPYRLRLGLYNWETGVRLPVRQSATSAPEDSLAVAVAIDGQRSAE